jgi:hypothetical protein
MGHGTNDLFDLSGSRAAKKLPRPITTPQQVESSLGDFVPRQSADDGVDELAQRFDTPSILGRSEHGQKSAATPRQNRSFVRHD